MSDAQALSTSEAMAATVQPTGSLWQTIVVLFKLRIVVLLLFAAMGGAFIASGGVPQYIPLLVLLYQFNLVLPHLTTDDRRPTTVGQRVSRRSSVVARYAEKSYRFGITHWRCIGSRGIGPQSVP
jgi:hypothetical protein